MALGPLGWVHSAELDIYKPTNRGGDGLFFSGKGRLVVGHDTIYLRKKCFKIRLHHCDTVQWFAQLPFLRTKCTRRCLVYQTYLVAEKSLLDRLKKQLREVRLSSAFLVLYKALSGTISIATFCGMRWSFCHFFTVLTVKKAHTPNYNENKKTGIEQNFTRELKTPKTMSHAFSYQQPDRMWSTHSSYYIPILYAMSYRVFCLAQSNGRDLVKQLSYVTAKVISHLSVTRFVLINKRPLITLFRSFFTDSKVNHKSGYPSPRAPKMTSFFTNVS